MLVCNLGFAFQKHCGESFSQSEAKRLKVFLYMLVPEIQARNCGWTGGEVPPEKFSIPWNNVLDIVQNNWT